MTTHLRKIRYSRVLAAAAGTHVAANLLLGLVLVLPGAVPVRDALALPILLVVGTAVAARWVARSAPLVMAPLHGVLVGGLVGLIAMAYGPLSGLLTLVPTVTTGWLSTARMPAPRPS